MIVSVTVAALLSSLAAADGIQWPDCIHGPLSKNKICDASVSIADRAKALIGELTVAEKINLTGSDSFGVPRLGVPSYKWWNEGLHGVASGHGINFSSSGQFSYATSFPQPILMSAAFDDNLIFDVATAISTEARAFSNDGRSGLDYWTPNINQFKDPRWGRGQETPGEDSFRVQQYVKALVGGFEGPQEDAGAKKIVATCKHYAAYDVEDWYGNVRYGFDAKVSQQDLFEFYLAPFQTCARDSQVGSIMCSYNSMNGIPTCADPWLLQTVLREHWNWTGEYQYVTSDCDSIQNIFTPHNYTLTREEAVAAALKAGTDLDCGTYYPLHLPTAYDQGLIDDATLDQAVTRLISAQLKLGYFDAASATPYRSLNWANVSTPAHQTLARVAAEKGAVLLKNNGVLPIAVSADKPQTWALLGAWANASTDLQGNYPGIAPYLHSPLYAAERLPGVTVHYSPATAAGGDPTTDGWMDAIAIARDADVVIFADGISNVIEAEARDRETIAWTPAQLDLIESLATLGKPLVILQMGGGQLDDTPLLRNPNISAILWGGYPGQDGGPALMNIVTGAVAPAGRLPVTQYPASYVDAVDMTDMALRPDENTGRPGRTYRWFGEAVLSFGFGLGYTKFDVAVSDEDVVEKSYDVKNLVESCDRKKHPYLDTCPFTDIKATVHNIGVSPATGEKYNVASDYVLLAFLTTPDAADSAPLKTLVGYQRLASISAGKSKTATLPLTLASLARRDENGDAVVYPGKYGIEFDVDGAAGLEFELVGDTEGVVIESVPRMDEGRLKWAMNGKGGLVRVQGVQQMSLALEVDDL